MRRICLLLLLVTASSCGRRQVPSPPIAGGMPAPPANRGLPSPIVPATFAGCELRGAWTADQPHQLQLADGSALATVHQPRAARVVLGANGKAAVELTTASIRIRGFVPGPWVLLHPAKPWIVGGYVAPGPTAAVRWVSTNQQGIRVEIVLPLQIRPKEPPRADRPCSDLAIDTAATFQPRDTFPPTRESPAMLPDAISIPLSPAAGGPPVAELWFDGVGPLVDVVERRGTEARVVVLVHALDPRDNVVVAGWVPASLLRPHTHGFGGSWSTGGDRVMLRPRIEPGARFVTCTKDIPLVVERAGTQVLAGAILAESVIEILPGADAGVAEVRAWPPTVDLGDGGRFLVDRAVIAGCAESAEPP